MDGDAGTSGNGDGDDDDGDGDRDGGDDAGDGDDDGYDKGYDRDRDRDVKGKGVRRVGGADDDARPVGVYRGRGGVAYEVRGRAGKNLLDSVVERGIQVSDIVRETAYKSRRNREEAAFLGTLLDAMLANDLHRAFDGAAQRLTGLQLVEHTGSWTAMDVVAPATVTSHHQPPEHFARLTAQMRAIDRARADAHAAQPAPASAWSGSDGARSAASSSGQRRRRPVRHGGQRDRTAAAGRSGDRDGGQPAQQQQRSASRAPSSRSVGASSGAGGAAAK